MHAPRSTQELAECIATRPGPFELIGGGSKRNLGRPVRAQPLSLAALTGVVDHRPEELVITARAATPLCEIERLLAAFGQRLAFEPPDLGELLGADQPQTVGGVLATNLAGSRRVVAGAARDHFLGFEAVSGRGEIFRAGGKVVKNVTGYDLPKLMAGSFGTLAVLTEVTLRAVPACETEWTCCVPVQAPEHAVALLIAALGSPHEVSGAAFDPQEGQVLLRLEGFEVSVRSRAASLQREIRAALDGLSTANSPASASAVESAGLRGDASRATWRSLGAARGLARSRIVWRVSVPPSDAPRVVRTLQPERYLLDWGGGLCWLGFETLDAARVRGALGAGHATLIKADTEARARLGAFHPLPAAVAALSARVKAAFDPQAKLNPGRMD
jgi:glycolate oxidase FAD binding subunit